MAFEKAEKSRLLQNCDKIEMRRQLINILRCFDEKKSLLNQLGYSLSIQESQIANAGIQMPNS